MSIKKNCIDLPKEGRILRLIVVLIALTAASARPSKKEESVMTDAELTVPDSLTGPQEGVNAASSKTRLEIGLDRDCDECHHTNFGDKAWLGFNVYDNAFAFNSPWDKSKLKFEEKPSTNEVMSYQLIYDKISLENSLATKATVSGSYFVFSMSASASYAQSTLSTSTSTSVEVLARHDSQSLSLPAENAQLVEMMSKEAKELAKKDPAAFVDKYGTHFISLQQYGCKAEMQGSYTFDSLKNSQEFKASLETKFKAGAFSFAASAEVEKLAKNAHENSTFFAQLKGDIFDIHPDEPSRLDSWAKALFENFNKECEANKERHEVKSVYVRSWSSLLTTIPAEYDLDEQNIQTLMKAKLTQQHTHQGLTAMANYFSKLGVAQPGQKQWIEKLGQTCRDSPSGPYDITGPRGVTSAQLLKAAAEVNKLGWTNNSKSLSPSERIAAFLKEASAQYKQYVIYANQLIPQVTIKMRRDNSLTPTTYTINAFDQPKMNNGVVQVCFQYSSPFVGRLDSGCKANVTAGDKMPVNDKIEFVPMMVIDPKATHIQDVLKVVNPPQVREYVYTYTEYAPTTSQCQMSVDIDNPKTSSCKGYNWLCTPWKKDKYAWCVPDTSNFEIDYSILEGTSDSLVDYKYPGCSQSLL